MCRVTQRYRTWPARKITAAMHAAGLTHEALAAELGCSRSNVSQVVGGLTKSWRVAYAIGDAIGRRPWEIWPRIYAEPTTAAPTTESTGSAESEPIRHAS